MPTNKSQGRNTKIASKPEDASGYAPVNGLDVYYELHGSGEPLVLLHGGVEGITMFGPVLPALAAHRQVIAVELQGHGRTADVDRPLTYEGMADDVAAVVEHLGVKRADVMGYSLGGGTALQVAIRHPGLVRKLVIVAQPFRRDGWYPEVLAAMAQLGPAASAGMAMSPLAKLYPKVDWAQLFTKLGALLSTDYDWSREVAAISAPLLLVFADADAVRPAHMLEFFGLFGGGARDAGVDGSARPAAQLAVLPGLTHYSIGSAPALAALVTPFLDAPLADPS